MLLKNILLEILNEEKKLRVFDFDDTLVTSDAKVYVTHPDGTMDSLSPSEYAVYEEQPGDEFDFSDFRGKLINPEPIKDMTKIFKDILKSGVGDHREIVILTARGDESPIIDFLKMIKVDPNKVTIASLGDASPERKKEWIEQKIQEGCDDILFFDDSEKNFQQVSSLRSKYPNVKIKTYLVEPDRKINL